MAKKSSGRPASTKRTPPLRQHDSERIQQDFLWVYDHLNAAKLAADSGHPSPEVLAKAKEPPPSEGAAALLAHAKADTKHFLNALFAKVAAAAQIFPNSDAHSSELSERPLHDQPYFRNLVHNLAHFNELTGFLEIVRDVEPEKLPLLLEIVKQAVSKLPKIQGPVSHDKACP